MTTPVIQVENVEKSFKNVRAVRGISLSVEPGEFVAVLGPNGAGKTTLVEMIEGIQKPDVGKILIRGMPWKGNENKLNRILGISLQETWFIEKLTVMETLVMFASFYHLGKDRANEILSLMGLEDKKKAYTKNLSGGQRQRLALGISLLNYPEILLLDEPTTGLDPNARQDIWQILMKLKEETNTSLVLTTHYMEEAQYLCDRIVIVDQGKILAQGTLQDLLARNGFKEIIEVGCEGDCGTSFSMLPGVSKVHHDKKSNHYTLEVNQITETLPLMLRQMEASGVAIVSLQSRKLTLNDLFISLTGRQLTE